MHPLHPRKDTALATLAASTCLLLLTPILFFGTFALVPAEAWWSTENFARPLSFQLIVGLLRAYIDVLRDGFPIAGPVTIAMAISHTVHDLLASGVGPSLLVRAAGAFTTATVLALQVRSALVANLVERPFVQHIRGPRLVAGRAAVRSLRSAWAKRFGKDRPGVELVDGLNYPTLLEVEHQQIIGGTGAGKSTIIERQMDSALKSGAKVLAIDVKGEVTAKLPIDDFALFSIDDARAVKWAIGRDVTTAFDALEMATEFIPDTADPSWSNGARQVLAALIQNLQGTVSGGWSWADLNKLLSTPLDQLYRLLSNAHPVEASFINPSDETRKTAMSFYLVLIACAGRITRACAETEKDSDSGPGFSIRDWFAGRERQKVVILRQSQRSPELSAAIVRLVLKVVADAGAEQGYQANPEPCWLFLDELPQIGKTEAIPRLAAIGRSAGLRIVVAMQSPAQLRAIFGAETARHLSDTLTTKIIGRLPPGETANEISKEWIGDRFVQWTERAGFHPDGKPRLEVVSRDIPVVAPEIIVL